MNSLREIVETSPQLRDVQMHSGWLPSSPQPLGPARWDWAKVCRVLVVRLRSIGDTVLLTPSLYALRRFLPAARIDILLEDRIAPLLDGFEYVDEVITLNRGSVVDRAAVIWRLRARSYDVAYNVHGGNTATLIMRACGATHRVGFAGYRYARLHNHIAPSPTLLWNRTKTHSVEQQLALFGWTGVPVSDRPGTRLAITQEAAASIAQRLRSSGIEERPRLAVIHPTAAFTTKQWATENFARAAEHLSMRGLVVVAIAAKSEQRVIHDLVRQCSSALVTMTDLSLPEVTALAARARLFVGNDSGIAHIAAAAGLPSVIVFGSSNVAHWRPWSSVPSEVVVEEMDCQPCHGYYCEKFEQPECIRRVPVQRVLNALDRVLAESEPDVRRTMLA